MKLITKQIKELKEEFRHLQDKNKELDEHIESLTQIYNLMLKQIKAKK